MALIQFFLPILRFSPVSIIPPLLHTHSFTYTFFQDKLRKPGSLPKSTALLDIGQYWTAKCRLRSVPCARVWIKHNTWRAAGPHDKLPCDLLSRIYTIKCSICTFVFPVSQIGQQITVQSPCITYLNSNTYNITYHERDAQSRDVQHLRHIGPTTICIGALH